MWSAGGIVGFFRVLQFLSTARPQACVVLQFGTALPDLMRLVDVDLETASWFFTVRCIGFVVGCFFFGVLFDRYNRLLVLSVCCLGLALSTLLTPFLLTYPVAVGLRAVGGVFCGGVDTGVNTIVPFIWGSKGGPYMQLLYFSYTIGGIVSPFMTEPFMAPKLNPDIQNSHVEGKQNTTFTDLYNLPEMNTTSSNVNHSEFSSNVYLGFIITSIVAFLSSISYIFMYCSGTYNVNVKVQIPENKPLEEGLKLSPEKEDKENKNTNSDVHSSLTDNEITGLENDEGSEKMFGKRKTSSWSFVVVFMSVAMVNALYSGAEECIGAYIFTFCLDYLRWGNAAAARLSSLYWVTSFVGGIGGVILVRVLGTGRLLGLTHLCWILAYLGAVFGALHHIDKLIWTCIPASGFFTVQIVPAAISWLEENICDITGKRMSVLMVVCGISATANPAVAGYMMQSWSYMSFIYILTVESVVSLLFCVVCYVVACSHFKRKSSKTVRTTTDT